MPLAQIRLLYTILGTTVPTVHYPLRVLLHPTARYAVGTVLPPATMAAQTSPSAPLLGNSQEARGPHHNHASGSSSDEDAELSSATTLHSRCRRFLASRRKHFLVMAVVALDVTALLANVFIQLIACEMHQSDEPWVQTITRSLETLGLFFSCLFMVELGACLFAFGFK